MQQEYQGLADKLGYTFKDPALLLQALTHTSYVSEHPQHEDNERLEFLGDSVLQMMVASWLFRTYPAIAEGEMTKARIATVSEEPQGQVAAMLDVGVYLRLGRGEEPAGRTRRRSLARALEALIAAVYLDGGMSAAEDCFLSRFTPFARAYLEGKKTDYKTHLQELLQSGGPAQIEYTLLEQRNDPQNPHFRAAVRCDGRVLGEGEGRTRKEAEQGAASQALKTMEKEEPNAPKKAGSPGV